MRTRCGIKPAGETWELLWIMLATHVLFGFALTPSPALAASVTGTAGGVLQRTTEAAKKEGKVVAEDLDFPPAAFSKVQEAFNRQYGFNVKIEWVPFENYPATAARVLTEHKSGVAASVDVVRIGERQDPVLAKDGAIVKVDWAPLLPAGTPPEVDIYKGWSLVWKTNIYCSVFDPKKISPSAVPSTWWDLANPSWNGKIVTVPWVQGYIVDFAVWLRKMEKGEIMARNEAIGKNKPIFQASDSIRRRMMAGEIVVTFFHPNDFVEIARRLGVSLNCKPMDYINVNNHLVAVRTRASHPNAAKLFAAFMVGPEASRLLESEAAAGNQWHPASFQAAMYEDLKKSGLPVLDRGREPGYAEWVESKGYEDLTRAINQVLRGR